jgi:hypothetical protein
LFRPQVLSTSRRFSPRSTPGACFISEPRAGLRSFRGFFPRAATLPRRKELPPCRWRRIHSPNVVRCPSMRASTSRS